MNLRRIALSSKRLSLKAFTPDDAAEIFDAVTPAVTRFMAFDPPPSLEQFADVWRSWLLLTEAGSELSLVVRLKPTGEFLGIVGLHGLGADEPEAGIWLKESVHGFGFGREAMSAAIDWASRACGVHAFLYPVVEENRPSRRLAESIGGVVVGARRLRKSGGIEHPEVVYRIPAPRTR